MPSTETGPTTTPLPSVRRLGLSALLFVPAIAGIALWVLWRVDPELLDTVLATAEAGLPWIGWAFLAIVIPASLAFFLLWPPAWPQVRVWFERRQKKLTFDRKAARDLTQRLEEFKNPRDLQALGQLYEQSLQPAAALPPLIEANELEPDNARTLYLMARAFHELGRPEEALHLVMRALELDPGIGFGEAWLLAGDLALATGDAKLAANLAKEHATRFGDSIPGLSILARAEQRLGEGAARIATLDRLAALPPASGKKFSPREALGRARARVSRSAGARS